MGERNHLLPGDRLPSIPDPFGANDTSVPPPENVFDFIDSLSLNDLDLPGAGMLPEGEDHAGASPDLSTQQPNSSSDRVSSEGDSKKYASGGRLRSQSRTERIRAKNRNAQARFRQKKKEECAKLEEQIAVLQAAVAKAHEVARERQQTRVQLSKRVADVTGELLATRNEQLHISNLEQQRNQQPAQAQQPAQPQPQQNFNSSLGGSVKFPSSHSSIGHSSSLKGLPVPDVRAPLYQSLVIKSRPEHHLYRNENMAPRSLATYRYYKPLFYTDLLDPEECIGGSLAAAAAYRETQAQQLGCSPDDVCLFAQLGLNVAPQVALSFSQTLSSPECAASFVMGFTITTLIHALCLKALEKGNRTTDPFEADIDGCSRKRTRRSQSGAQPQAATAAMHAAINSAMPRGSQGAAQSQAAERLPVEDLMQELQDLQEGDLGGSLGLGSMDMEELFSSMTTEQQSMATSITEQSGGMYVRCGVNERYPLIPAGTNLVLEALRTVEGALEVEEIQQVCQVVVRQVSTFHSTRYHKPGAVQGQGMILLARDKGSLGATLAPEDAAYFQQVTNHLGAVILSTNAVLERFIKQPFFPAGQVPAELAPDVVQRLERRMAELTHASSMGDKLVFMNATRIMFNLTADALSPLMAMYEVDNHTYQVFKDLKLTQPQKEQLGDLWTVWEARRRKLDGDMKQAKTLLNTLPSTAPIPYQLLSHLTLLLNQSATEMHTPPHTPSPSSMHGMHGMQQGAFSEPAGSDAPMHAMHGGPYGNIPEDHAPNQRLLHNIWPDSGPSSFATRGSDLSGHAAWGWNGGASWGHSSLPCLGQDARCTAAAAEALEQLNEVHFNAAHSITITLDYLVDCAQGPHRLDNRQMSKLQASQIIYQTIPFDAMAISQIASMQCKRAELFHAPRPCF